VAVVDTDIQSSGIHVIFKAQQGSLKFFLNDFLWRKCEIEEAALEVTPMNQGGKGKLYLIPSSANTGDIARIINDGYNVELLSERFNRLCENPNSTFCLSINIPG